MFEGVFDQAEHHHGGHFGRVKALWNIPLNLQTIFHAHFLNVEVRANDAQLLTQVPYRVGRLLAHVGQCGTQQSDQAFLHQAGARRIGFNQMIDGGQGVEQEVGFYLRLHGGHARLHQLTLELLGFSQVGGRRGFFFSLNLLFENGLDHNRNEDDHEAQLRHQENARGN